MQALSPRLALIALVGCLGLPLGCQRPQPRPAPQPTPATPTTEPAAAKPVEPPAMELPPTTVADRRELAPGLTMARLSNGLTVLVEEDHASPVCTVRYYVKNTGSAYEDRYLGAGLSHVLEHLVSGGTTSNHTAEQFEAATDAMGGNTNAYTTSNMTAYHITAAGRHAGRCIELLGDMMRNCLFEPDEYRREMQVVQRELTMREAQRGSALWEMNARNLYGDHPAAVPTIGYTDVLARVERDQIMAFYHERYVPENLTLVVVGDVDTEAVIEKARRTFLNVPRRSRPPILLPEPRPITGPRHAYREMDGELTDLRLSFPTVSLLDPDLYALDVLSTILGDGESSRLNVRIRDGEQRVTSIGSYSYTPSFVSGMLTVYATLKPENLDAAREAILGELERLIDEPVTPEELAKAKKQMAAKHVLYRQEVGDRAETLAYDWIGTGNPLFSRQYVERIQQVTADEVQAVARRHIDRSRLCEAAVVPRGRLPHAEGAAATQAAPTVKKLTLQNGLTVLLKHNPAVPVVAVQAYYNAGVLVETDANNGINNLTADMLLKGSEAHSAQQIADYFDSIGATINTGGGRNTGFLTAQVLSDDFASATAWIAEVLRQPAFPEDELAKLKARTLAALRNREADLNTELYDLVLANLPETTPYRRRTQGTIESVESLGRDALAAFHRRYVVPNNLVLAVYGDVPLDRAEAAVRRHFADWEPNRQLRLPRFSEPFRVEPGPPVVKTTGKPSAGIQMVFPTTTLKQVRDNAALEVLFAVMAGYYMPGGWLHEELRGEGLVYVVHAGNAPSRAPGMATVYAQCEPEKVDEVIGRIEAKLDKAAAGKIARDEFQKARQRVIAFREIQSQTNASQATRDALDELYGLGYKHHEQELDLLRQVQLSDVKRVARQYLGAHLTCITRPDAK